MNVGTGRTLVLKSNFHRIPPVFWILVYATDRIPDNVVLHLVNETLCDRCSPFIPNPPSPSPWNVAEVAVFRS